MHFARGKEEYTVVEGHDWFWEKFADGSWEPSTFQIFDRFLSKEKNFLDIGAWIGPTALYAAPRANQVFAFEPDPVAYASLVRNLELNKADNVVPYQTAVSDSWKGIPFGKKNVLGDSMSSQLWDRGEWQVPAVSFEALVLDIAPNFIKIDIEGGEKFLFDGAQIALAQMKPTIMLSLHTPWFHREVPKFVDRIKKGLEPYPYFYDRNFKPVTLEEVIDVNVFNSVIASFEKI